MPNVPDWLSQIGAMMPADQAQINNAVLADGTPLSIAAPPDQMALMQTPSQGINSAVMKMPEAPMPKAASQMSPAFNKYLPPKQTDSQSDQTNAYGTLSKQALADQAAAVSGLNQYIDDIAKKPRGLDLSALAAYVDSTTGSKLYDSVHAAAPMTQDQKDQMLFGLRNKAAQDQAKLSADQLKALQEQQAHEQYLSHQDEWKRHNQAMEGKGAGMADARMMMAQTRQDDQTSKAVDLVTKDPQLKSYIPRIQGADRILGQLAEVRAGKIVDTRQFLNDLNTEYVNLLTGANNSALGKQERTEYKTYSANISALKQEIKAHPESINSPEILNQLENSVQSLQKTYHANFDQRADLLKRHYRYNQDANDQLEGAITSMKGQYGSKALAAETPSAHPQDSEAVSWAKAHSSDPRAQAILKMNGGN